MTGSSTHTAQAVLLAQYDALSDAIFRYVALRISDRETALDITHDTFAKAWEYSTKGGVIENWKAFLFRTAHNRIIDHYRKKKSISLDAMTEDVGFVPHAEEYGAEHTTEYARAVRALNLLPEEYRDILLLTYVEGMQPKDIAEIMSVTPNVISVRIHRGMEKLRDILNPHTP